MIHSPTSSQKNNKNNRKKMIQSKPLRQPLHKSTYNNEQFQNQNEDSPESSSLDYQEQIIDASQEHKDFKYPSILSFKDLNQDQNHFDMNKLLTGIKQSNQINKHFSNLLQFQHQKQGDSFQLHNLSEFEFPQPLQDILAIGYINRNNFDKVLNKIKSSISTNSKPVGWKRKVMDQQIQLIFQKNKLYFSFKSRDKAVQVYYPFDMDVLFGYQSNFKQPLIRKYIKLEDLHKLKYKNDQKCPIKIKKKKKKTRLRKKKRNFAETGINYWDRYRYVQDGQNDCSKLSKFTNKSGRSKINQNSNQNLQNLKKLQNKTVNLNPDPTKFEKNQFKIQKQNQNKFQDLTSQKKLKFKEIQFEKQELFGKLGNFPINKLEYQVNEYQLQKQSKTSNRSKQAQQQKALEINQQKSKINQKQSKQKPIIQKQNTQKLTIQEVKKTVTQKLNFVKMRNSKKQKEKTIVQQKKQKRAQDIRKSIQKVQRSRSRRRKTFSRLNVIDYRQVPQFFDPQYQFDQDSKSKISYLSRDSKKNDYQNMNSNKYSESEKQEQDSRDFQFAFGNQKQYKTNNKKPCSFGKQNQEKQFQNIHMDDQSQTKSENQYQYQNTPSFDYSSHFSYQRENFRGSPKRSKKNDKNQKFEKLEIKKPKNSLHSLNYQKKQDLLSQSMTPQQRDQFYKIIIHDKMEPYHNKNYNRMRLQQIDQIQSQNLKTFNNYFPKDKTYYLEQINMMIVRENQIGIYYFTYRRNFQVVNSPFLAGTKNYSNQIENKEFITPVYKQIFAGRKNAFLTIQISSQICMFLRNNLAKCKTQYFQMRFLKKSQKIYISQLNQPQKRKNKTPILLIPQNRTINDQRYLYLQSKKHDLSFIGDSFKFTKILNLIQSYKNAQLQQIYFYENKIQLVFKRKMIFKVNTIGDRKKTIYKIGKPIKIQMAWKAYLK